MLKIFDSDQVTLGLGNVLVEGYADGEFLRIEADADTFTKVVGTDGQVSRSKTNNRAARITVIVMQTSASNDLLSAIHNVDRDAPNGAGVFPVYIRDRSGRSLYTAANGWIALPPKPSFGREATSREWVIDVDVLERIDAGN